MYDVKSGGDVMNLKYVFALVIPLLLLGCTNTGSGDYLTPQEVSIEKIWTDEYPQGFDPYSNEVMITTWDGEEGFTYMQDTHRITGFLTIPMQGGQTLDSVKYKIENDTLMIFINLKELSTSSETTGAMSIYVRIEDDRIDNLITSEPPFKFKKPVKVFINGEEMKVIGGEQIYKQMIIY